MSLNQTISPDMLVAAHQQVAIPQLISLWMITILIFLVVGLFSIKNSKQKFMLIWGIAGIVSGLILVAFIFEPLTILNFISSITK